MDDGERATDRPNAEIVRRVYDAFARRDIPAVLGLLAPDVEITQSSEIPWGGSYKGHDGALRFFGNLTQAITSAVALERLVDAGDHVVAIGRTQGTVNATGARFDVPIAHVWAFRDGLGGAYRVLHRQPDDARRPAHLARLTRARARAREDYHGFHGFLGLHGSEFRTPNSEIREIRVIRVDVLPSGR